MEEIKTVTSAGKLTYDVTNQNLLRLKRICSTTRDKGKLCENFADDRRKRFNRHFTVTFYHHGFLSVG